MEREDDGSLERLNKVLARAGVASRRGADALIAAGRITVNGRRVTDLGTKVDPRADEVRLDGARVGGAQATVTVALHKPPNVLTTVSDPLGRPTVMAYVDVGERLYPVGRLDFASEGLVILTNDGDLAQQLAHPRYRHEREYRVRVSGTPTEATLKVWRDGVYLEDGRTAPAIVEVVSSSGGSTWLRVVLREGRNRQIRRMVEALKHRVHRLVRVRMGAVALGDLPAGAWRRLTRAEVAALRSGADLPAGARASESGPRPDRAAAAGRGRPRYKPGWARPKPKPSRKPGRKRRS
jgi:23S rRNA pseudouridine2605 synthase